MAINMSNLDNSLNDVIETIPNRILKLILETKTVNYIHEKLIEKKEIKNNIQLNYRKKINKDMERFYELLENYFTYSLNEILVDEKRCDYSFDFKLDLFGQVSLYVLDKKNNPKKFQKVVEKDVNNFIEHIIKNLDLERYWSLYTSIDDYSLNFEEFEKVYNNFFHTSEYIIEKIKSSQTPKSRLYTFQILTNQVENTLRKKIPVLQNYVQYMKNEKHKQLLSDVEKMDEFFDQLKSTIYEMKLKIKEKYLEYSIISKPFSFSKMITKCAQLVYNEYEEKIKKLNRIQ